MGSFFILVVVFSKLLTLFTVAAVLISLFSAISGFVWLVTYVESRTSYKGVKESQEEISKKAKTFCKISLPIAILSIFLAIWTPSMKEMFLIGTFKAVDAYNAENKTSLVSTNGVLSTVDNMLGLVNTALDKANSLFGSKKE